MLFRSEINNLEPTQEKETETETTLDDFSSDIDIDSEPIFEEEIFETIKDDIAENITSVDFDEAFVDEEKNSLDASANIINNFAKLFAETSKEEKVEDKKQATFVETSSITELGDGTKTIENVVENVIKQIVSASVSEKMVADYDLTEFAKQEIKLQTKKWLDENLSNIVETTVQKEIEKVMAKVGK